ncbi:hypothetical protein [Citrobacter braakii]|uniref:Uncharacterized protein n=1 Tax=Citrobacter braakii TaxID=57706 RepID=A0A1V8NS98_CITBR|nr:hypothetical protein [Citrobacter braakii]OQM39284.1 hypothetical protein BZK42_25740 [Citrobacter braakii]QXC17443.1 hypothetical protein I6L51_04970 [Citrobacter braakii]
MGSNIIELAKLGHERAAELKASCGAVDVRSLAQLISDLATQLEVQFVRSTNQAVQLANAESKCRELAAESVTVKECASDVMRHVYRSKTYLDSSRVVDAIQGLQCAIERKAGKAPATDAFLAEVRASAVDEACLKISSAIVNCYQDEQIGLDAAATICGDFAAQLRKGSAL